MLKSAKETEERLVAVRLDTEEIEILDRLEELGLAANTSEAIRFAIRVAPAGAAAWLLDDLPTLLERVRKTGAGLDEYVSRQREWMGPDWKIGDMDEETTAKTHAADELAKVLGADQKATLGDVLRSLLIGGEIQKAPERMVKDTWPKIAIRDLIHLADGKGRWAPEARRELDARRWFWDATTETWMESIDSTYGPGIAVGGTKVTRTKR